MYVYIYTLHIYRTTIKTLMLTMEVKGMHLDDEYMT